MPSLTVIKIGVMLVLVALWSLFAYNTGYDVASSKYEKEKAVAATKAVEQIKEAQETDQQVVEKRQEQAQIVTRTITKVQREIIKLPPRDCGFTSDERMSINAAYCASFPSAPSCMSDAVPGSSPSAPAQRGEGKTAVGS